jgi:hypothetical protein
MESEGGYGKEDLGRKLLVLAHEISKDKNLVNALKRDVPKIEESIRNRIKNGKNLGIKR